MSINLMDRVWYREDLRTMEKFVALALADSAGDDGACYPSIIRIAKKCSCVPRTVQIALRDLERRQLVRRYRRKDRTDFFQLKIGRASCRERVCQYVYISVVAVSLQIKRIFYINYRIIQ